MNGYEKRPINADNRTGNQKEKQTTKTFIYQVFGCTENQRKIWGRRRKEACLQKLGSSLGRASSQTLFKAVHDILSCAKAQQRRASKQKEFILLRF